MYSYLTGQFIHLFHYFFSLFLLLVLIPRFFFRAEYHHDAVDRFAMNFMKASFVLVSLGYLLVLLRLFELLSIVFLLALIGIRLLAYRNKSGSLEGVTSNYEAMLYDYVEGKYKFRDVLVSYVGKLYKALINFIKERLTPPERLVSTLSLLAVLGFAMYIRFYDALFYAASSYSHRYTTLKWIKDIRENKLFNDGVAQQGFHIYWAAIQEFSRIDALYIVKYTGPLIDILIILGIYFVLSRLTTNRMSGIVGISVYVFLGEFLDPSFLEWQALADSETFAYIFFLPTLYYLVIYLREDNRESFYTMCSGMVVIALIHLGTYIVLFFALCLVCAFLFLSKQKREQASIPDIFKMWAVAGGLSLLPIVFGLFLSNQVHTSFWDSFSTLEDSFILIPSPTMFPLLCSALVGILWYYTFQRLSSVRSFFKFIEQIVMGLVVIFGLLLASHQPVEPLKVDWDSAVGQYINISKEFPARHWMIISKEDFATIVQGNGYHMNISELVNNYDPLQKNLTLIGATAPDLNLAPHIFIYYEKSFREVNKDFAKEQLSSSYDRWGREKKQLWLWLKHYTGTHEQVHVYYEDEQIIIYHLERVDDLQEKQKDIWGEVK